MSEESQQALKALRKDLRQLAGRAVPTGTVLRVTTKGSYGDDLTWVAVWIEKPRKWYLTGIRSYPKTHRQFLDWVADEAVKVEVASEWEVL